MVKVNSKDSKAKGEKCNKVKDEAKSKLKGGDKIQRQITSSSQSKKQTRGKKTRQDHSNDPTSDASIVPSGKLRYIVNIHFFERLLRHGQSDSHISLLLDFICTRVQVLLQ